jgi:hypothetical protein
MIIVRFFTGVTVKYEKAEQIIYKNDGRIEIKTGTHPENGDLLAILQPSCGAIIENGDCGKMIHPAFPTGTQK